MSRHDKKVNGGPLWTYGHLESYVRYCRSIKQDIEDVIVDIKAGSLRGAVHYAVDFCELRAYLVNDSKSASKFWPWPNVAQSTASAWQGSALEALLFGGNLRPILLEPYALEFHSHRQSLVIDEYAKTTEAFDAALNEVARLLEGKDSAALREIAHQRRMMNRITETQASLVLKVLEKHGTALLELARDDSSTASRMNRLHGAKRFSSLASVCGRAPSIDKTRVNARASRLNELRGRKGADYLDALAIELVYSANQLVADSKKAVRLVSRDTYIKKIVAEEVSQGWWDGVGGSPLRNPRCFTHLLHPYASGELDKAPLGAHASIEGSSGNASSTIEQLALSRVESYCSGIDILLDAAHKSNPLKDEDKSALLKDEDKSSRLLPRDLAQHIKAVSRGLRKFGALSSVRHASMGSGGGAALVSLNESVQDGRDQAGSALPSSTLKTIQQALLLISSREDLAATIDGRIAELGKSIDKANDMLGWYESTPGSPDVVFEAIESSSISNDGALTVHSAPEPMLFTLELDPAGFDDAQHSVTLNGRFDMRQLTKLLNRASDDYQRRVLMAFSIGACGRWDAAEVFAGQALKVGMRRRVINDGEARLLLAMCKRLSDPTVVRLREAVRLIDEAMKSKALVRGDVNYQDARYVAELGTIQLAWASRERDTPDQYRQHDSPTLEMASSTLTCALEKAPSGEKRLRLRIENNLIYAHLLLGNWTELALKDRLDSLWETATVVEAEVRYWHIGILDTFTLGYSRVCSHATAFMRATLVSDHLAHALQSGRVRRHDQARMRAHLEECRLRLGGAWGDAG